MAGTFDHEDLLALPLVANLATCDPTGAPRNAPVWYQWDQNALFMLADDSSSSVRRIRDNPAVAVEIVEYDNPRGIMRHLGLRGKASIEPMDPTLFRRLLSRYLGPDESAWNAWFISEVARIDDPAGRLIRLAPDSIFTNNVSFFRTGPRLAVG